MEIFKAIENTAERIKMVIDPVSKPDRVVKDILAERRMARVERDYVSGMIGIGECFRLEELIESRRRS